MRRDRGWIPGGHPDESPPRGGERIPGGPGGLGPSDGGGGGPSGGLFPTSDPNVFLRYTTIGGTICRCACLVLTAAVCATVADACETAVVFTFGGVTVPCAALLRVCIFGGSQAAGQFCSEYVCPE